MFVGRGKELSEIFEVFSKPRPSIVVVRAPTGRGKTALLKEVARKSRGEAEQSAERLPSLNDADLICGLHETPGEFEDWAFPYLSVLREIMASLGGAGTGGPQSVWFAKALRKTFQSNLGKIAGAIVQDVMKGLPKTSATITEVYAAFSRKSTAFSSVVMRNKQAPDFMWCNFDCISCSQFW